MVKSRKLEKKTNPNKQKRGGNDKSMKITKKKKSIKQKNGWFEVKVNDKAQARPTSIKGEKTQTANIRKEILQTLKEVYEYSGYIYANKLSNLNKISKFFESHKLS